MMRMVPLLLFVVLAGFLWRGLSLNPQELPSPLIGKDAPAFALPALPIQGMPQETVSPATLKGQPWVLNVWASWCRACVDEHPVLIDMAHQSGITLVGLNYKDDPDQARAWLGQLGNPYDLIADDRDGKAGIDWGVYGVPETFFIDAEGKIRVKHTGPISPEQMQKQYLPLLEELKEQARAS